MKITTAADLEEMSLEERRLHFEASIVRDLNQLPPQFVSRVQDRFVARLRAEAQ